jgi:hypothetical protein
MSLAGDVMVFNAQSFKFEAVSQFKYLLYLLLPMLCIPSLQRFETACKVMVLTITVICWTAVLEISGIISLDFISIADRGADAGRFYSSGLGKLPRSAGLVGEFGTLAVLTAFTIPMLLPIGRDELKGFKWTVAGFWKICVVTSLLVAIIVAQSRNVFLASLLTIGIILLLKIIFRDIDVKKIIIAFILYVVIIVGCIVFVVNFHEVNTFIIGKSGMRASVYARFAQYKWATDLISENILFGIEGALKVKHNEQIAALHNFWLNQMIRFGVVGTLPLVLILLKSAKGVIGYIGKTQARDMPIRMFAFSFAFVFAGMFYAAHGAVYYWFAAGLIMAFDATAYREIYTKEKVNEKHTNPQPKFQRNVTQ